MTLKIGQKIPVHTKMPVSILNFDPAISSFRKAARTHFLNRRGNADMCEAFAAPKRPGLNLPQS
jgi:hypothetical protein